jgi:hypothetical protein
MMTECKACPHKQRLIVRYREELDQKDDALKFALGFFTNDDGIVTYRITAYRDREEIRRMAGIKSEDVQVKIMRE